MSVDIALYCKSYRTDAKRTRRLAESVQRFNTERLPFYISCPPGDMPLFRDFLSGLPVELISDDEIVACNSRIDKEKFTSIRGSYAQQVIKSEFWRLGVSDTYLCIDSDSMFIRPFSRQDFLLEDGTPYTVINEAHEMLDLFIRTGRNQHIHNFMDESERFKKRFGRSGRNFSFGPNPLIWHRSVWESLEQNFLAPKEMSIVDAILQDPLDMNWYGEALLSYKAIPLIPCQALFKVYHYAWQFDMDRRTRVNTEKLAQVYCGLIYQSTWERKMDWPSEMGSFGSRVARRLRRLLRRA